MNNVYSYNNRYKVRTGSKVIGFNELSEYFSLNRKKFAKLSNVIADEQCYVIDGKGYRYVYVRSL